MVWWPSWGVVEKWRLILSRPIVILNSVRCCLLRPSVPRNFQTFEGDDVSKFWNMWRGLSVTYHLVASIFSGLKRPHFSSHRPLLYHGAGERFNLIFLVDAWVSYKLRTVLLKILTLSSISVAAAKLFQFNTNAFSYSFFLCSFVWNYEYARFCDGI